MEVEGISGLLDAWVSPDPEKSSRAKMQLAWFHKFPGFAPVILRLTLHNSVASQIKNTAAIYLKHYVNNYWRDIEGVVTEPFTICEEDRVVVRKMIVYYTVQVPEFVKTQLMICIRQIIRNDYPKKWPGLVEDIQNILQYPQQDMCIGAVDIMYQLMKIFQDEEGERSIPYKRAISIMLPTIFQLLKNCCHEQTMSSILLQKNVLKIYCAVIQRRLGLLAITQHTFSQLMLICLDIVYRPMLPLWHLNAKEKPEFPLWKLKKWAIHMMLRSTVRFATLKANGECTQFAAFFIKTFSERITNAMLWILHTYKNKEYISPSVLCDALCYIESTLKAEHVWEHVEPRMEDIIRGVIFPLLSCKFADYCLWHDDPKEYIRVKFDKFVYMRRTPEVIAHSLLRYACKTYENLLPRALSIILEMIDVPRITDAEKEGVFHMFGILADSLVTQMRYYFQVETMLTIFVLPELKCRSGHLRARACWVFKEYCKFPLLDDWKLRELMDGITYAVLKDRELPVKCQAAIALEQILCNQDDASEHVKSGLYNIVEELLMLINQITSVELINAMQGIVCTYQEKLVPVARKICRELARAYTKISTSEECTYIKSMGILHVMKFLLLVMADRHEVRLSMEPSIIRMTSHILEDDIGDYCDEVIGILELMSARSISPNMWKMLDRVLLEHKIQDNSFFVHILPVLYNFVAVDTNTFLLVPKRLEFTFRICKRVLTNAASYDDKITAAKLLEVIMVHCKGYQVDGILSHFIKVGLKYQTAFYELKALSLQIAIAAMYCDPLLFFTVLDTMPQPEDEPLSSVFIKKWLRTIHAYYRVHDAKLSILSLCILISLDGTNLPVLSELGNQFVPAIIVLFNYLEEHSQKQYDDLDDDEHFAIETFKTTIDRGGAVDEYCFFKETLDVTEQNDKAWYFLLLSGLTPEMNKRFELIMREAGQRIAVQASTSK